jgi:hypothetical protein
MACRFVSKCFEIPGLLFISLNASDRSVKKEEMEERIPSCSIKRGRKNALHALKLEIAK